MKRACPESWPTGITSLLHQDIPCDKDAKHRGWHVSASGDVKWTGKLTDEERAERDRMRAHHDAVILSATMYGGN